MAELNDELMPRSSKESLWRAMLDRVRREANTMLSYGEITGKVTSLIALAGLLYWCPRCGQWMGPASEGKGEAVPSPSVPPVPPRLIRAISSPLSGKPSSVQEQPRRDGNKLTRNSGVLEGASTYRGVVSKVRHQPPSNAHGRKVERFYDGYPNPDSRPHAHEATFVRGDDELIPLYDRLKDRTVIYDNGVDVVFEREDGSYTWTPKPTNSSQPQNGDNQ